MGGLQNVLPDLGGPNCEHPRMLILERTHTRRWLNLVHLKALAHAEGFNVSTLRFEELTFWEQVQAVRTSAVFVGVHGNGLSHVLWMCNGSVLLEMFPIGTHFWEFELRPGTNLNPRSNFGSLAAAVAVHHIAWLDPRSPPEEQQKGWNWRNKDVRLDLK
eukprot:TRINITY_DN7096_c0_g1_i5.p2 TRINITY_DN7096_c0_g1~~TRINITY_DN7096_c0_g1_i5.p2  ORF type:complete len:160 (-),score=44.01 TRINITY_DN7096_c0_g1_i5:150-629(-)